jgi:ABC-2 type transport system ATP-binding protein
MSNVVARLDALSVSYGARLALDGVSMVLERGQVLALLGRNGAGKTTALRCLLGLERPRAGRAQLFGEDAWSGRARLMRRVGYVPEEPFAPLDLGAAAIGRLVAALTPGFDAPDYRACLERGGVPPGVRFGQLSRGQKAQVALALALAPHPELLILDDPSLGLDVVARRALYAEVITELADRGVTVLLATHDLDAVDRVATHAVVLAAGRVALAGELEELKARSGSLEEIFTTASREAA